MKIAITGANGYVGRHLVAALEKRGHSLSTLVRSKKDNNRRKSEKLIEGDLNNTNALSDLVMGCSVVCNLAGEYINEDKFIETNVSGMRNLFNISKKSSVRKFIQLSTVGVYGSPRYGLYEENAEMKAVKKYEKSKMVADEWLLSANSSNMETVIIRPSTVFGPGMKNNSLRELVALIAKGSFPLVGKEGSMGNYIYIDNLISSIIAVIEDLKTQPILQIYNLNNPTTIEALVQSVTGALDIPYPRIRVPYWFVFIVASFCDVLAGIFGLALPLSINRLNELTSRAIFSSRRFDEKYSYQGHVSVENGIQTCANHWVGK